MQPTAFLVTDIRLADNPIQARRGVLMLDSSRSPPAWQVVIYDPRPESLAGTAGLELPFSCRDREGTLLTGWVTVGAGDPALGVWCLRGLRQLRARPLWHRARRFRRSGADLRIVDDDDQDMDRIRRASTYTLPALLQRLGTRRALLVAATAVLCAWGAVSLMRDLGRGLDLPVTETVTVQQTVRPAPVLSLRVAILEQLGFSHRWVELRDALALYVLRVNGVEELHALLPGRDCVLATDRGGRCQLVLSSLTGQRQYYRAVVRQLPLGGGFTYLAGLVATMEP